MHKRPLASACFAAWIIGFLMVHFGGAEFVKELRTSETARLSESGTTVEIKGQIYRKEKHPKNMVLYLKNNSIYFKNKSHEFKKNENLKERKLLVYIDDDKASVGDIILARGELKAFESARNPGNFDQKAYYQKQDIHACLFGENVKIIKKTTQLWKEELSEARQRWKQIFTDAAGKEQGAVLSAMILGEKSDMDDELKELYRVAGIGHVLAISGLHLSIIGVGVYKLIRRAIGSYLIAGAAGILFLSIYILMIGLSVSALRAVVMFVIRVGADMSGRVYDVFTALSVAAVAVIMWRPLSYYDSGFYLSFGAVIGIVAVLPLFEGKKKLKSKGTRTRIKTFLSGGFLSGLCVQFITLPVIIYSFYEFPLYSILLNLIVIPLMSLLLICGIAGSIFYLAVPAAGNAVIMISVIILKLYEQLSELAGRLPASRIVCGQPKMWQMVFYYLCLLLGFYVWKKGKRWRKNGLILLGTGTLILLAGNQPGRYGSLLVTAIDVGQGDSIFIRGPDGSTCLVDGGSSDIKSVGKYRIESYLKYEGVGKLDYVFLTHGDEDHINGIAEMMERMQRGVKIKRLVLPAREVWDEKLTRAAETAEKYGIKVYTIQAGQGINRGEIKIECVCPKEGQTLQAGNEASLVLSVEYKDFRMLLTGDIEGTGEEQMTEMLKRQNKEYALIKTAHHGSKNSTSDEFLDVARPSIAVISSGQNNRYGHPHEETLKKFKDRNIENYNTAKLGAVMIWSDGKKMTIRTKQ